LGKTLQKLYYKIGVIGNSLYVDKNRCCSNAKLQRTMDIDMNWRKQNTTFKHNIHPLLD